MVRFIPGVVCHVHHFFASILRRLRLPVSLVSSMWEVRFSPLMAQFARFCRMRFWIVVCRRRFSVVHFLPASSSNSIGRNSKFVTKINKSTRKPTTKSHHSIVDCGRRTTNFLTKESHHCCGARAPSSLLLSTSHRFISSCSFNIYWLAVASSYNLPTWYGHVSLFSPNSNACSV